MIADQHGPGEAMPPVQASPGEIQAAFCQAVDQQDAAGILKWAAAGANPDFVEEKHAWAGNPLERSIANASDEVIDALLQCGAVPGQMAADCAIEFNRPQVLKKILEQSLRDKNSRKVSVGAKRNDGSRKRGFEHRPAARTTKDALKLLSSASHQRSAQCIDAVLSTTGCMNPGVFSMENLMTMVSEIFSWNFSGTAREEERNTQEFSALVEGAECLKVIAPYARQSLEDWARLSNASLYGLTGTRMMAARCLAFESIDSACVYNAFNALMQNGSRRIIMRMLDYDHIAAAAAKPTGLPNGMTSLHLAAGALFLPMAQRLISMGASVRALAQSNDRKLSVIEFAEQFQEASWQLPRKNDMLALLKAALARERLAESMSSGAEGKHEDRKRPGQSGAPNSGA